MGANLSIGLAFLAGLASFLSPCVFSLVPAYIGYLGGRSAASAVGGKTNRWLTLSHGVAFVVGFSLVFIILGVATSALGGLLFNLRTWLARIGGIVVIIFGLHMTGIFRIPFLEYDLRPQTAPDRNRGYLASALMGVFFSAGWSPCVGPVLGAILTLALNGGSIAQGVQLLSAYSAGLAIPFLLASTQIGLVTKVIRRYGKLMRYVEITMGAILIVVGIMLFAGRYESIASLGSFFGPIDELVVGRYLLIGIVSLAILGLLPAWLASKKGRTFLDWWLFGWSLFPIALVAAVLIRPERKLEEGETDDHSAGSSPLRSREQGTP
jgi:cytochrome c-type biogenesis protein